MLDHEYKSHIRARASALTSLPLEAGEIFYQELFRTQPDVRPLFGESLGDQIEKLIDMVFLMVHFVDNVDTLAPEIEELGVRHVAYGMRPEHLDAAKQALLTAFEATLPDWSAEDRTAWQALLDHLGSIMEIGLLRAQAGGARQSA